jgi:hypothetical protein
MSTPSQHFQNLKSDIRELRKHLLPRKFDTFLNYKPIALTRSIAFCIMSHSAIEFYFEEICCSVAQKAARDAKSRIVKQSGAALLSFSASQYRLPPDTLSPPQPSQSKDWKYQIDIFERIQHAASLYINEIRIKNHGVRESNILSLCLPVGVLPDSIDPIMVTELDDLGKARGGFAHKGLHAHVRNAINPQDEFMRISRIMRLIQPLDLGLVSLLI